MDRPQIVFIHPPLVTSLIFIYQIEKLCKKFTIIIFDIRGHGRSQYSSQAVTYPLIVEDIRHLLNHFEIKKAFICGYSVGGSIVLEFLLNSNMALGGNVISGMSEVKDWYLKQSFVSR